MKFTLIPWTGGAGLDAHHMNPKGRVPVLARGITSMCPVGENILMRRLAATTTISVRRVSIFS
jgi:hypothetical protein